LAERSIGLSAGGSVANVLSSTYYGNFGNSSTPFPNASATTEVNTALTHAGPTITLKRLRVTAPVNTRTVDNVITVRKNGADTSITTTVPALTTGTVFDITNTASIAAGDTYGYRVTSGGGGGATTIPAVTITMEGASQSAIPLSNLVNGVTLTPSGATRYLTIAGRATAFSSGEASTQTPAPVSGTWSRLGVYATAIRATTTVVTSRINGADGDQSVNVTATGFNVDASNTDSVSAGDSLAFKFTNSTGSDAFTTTNFSSILTPSSAQLSGLVGGAAAGSCWTSGATSFLTPGGNILLGATESDRRASLPFNGTLDRLGFNISSSALTGAETVTGKVILNGTATALSVQIASGFTGVAIDTSNSVFITEYDEVSLETTQSSSNVVTSRAFSMRMTAEEEGVYKVIASPGSFALTGVSSSLLMNRLLAAQAGSFALTGQAVNWVRGFGLTVAPGSYSTTGAANDFLRTYRMPSNAGSYVRTGVAAALSKGIRLLTDTGSYSVSGVSNSFNRTYILHSGVGMYEVELHPFDLIYSGDRWIPRTLFARF
jgi:hypothetical protein